MPVEFLSRERRERLGRFSDDPTGEQLARYFHLDGADRALVERRGRERARLGFALQLGTVRFLGTLLVDPTEVPRVVVDYVSRQLDIVGIPQRRLEALARFTAKARAQAIDAWPRSAGWPISSPARSRGSDGILR